MDENKKSREVILARIRSIGRSGKSSYKKESLKMNKKNIEIKYVSDLEKFISKLEESKATVSVINNKSEIIVAVHKYVMQHRINAGITISNDSNFTSLDWDSVDWNDANITTQYEPETLTTSVTFAWMGIEETGTLVMLSSPESPTGMNFLPDHHFIILDSSKVVKTMEDVWAELSKKEDGIPRSINLITGPSRTADIEYEIQIGAHGPKSLHVIIIKSS